jgi:rod shape-determining protein MreD
VRSPWRLWGTVVVLFLLHFLLHLGIGLGRVAPDLLTVALLLAARHVGAGTAAGLGFAFGVMEDAFSVLAFGASTLALTVVGAAGASTRDLFVGDSFLFVVSYLFIGKWTRDLLHWVMVGESLREPFTQAMLVEGSIAALYATAVGLLAMTLSGAWSESFR